MFRYSFRSLVTVYFVHERIRTLLALAGIALGVAVLLAINMSVSSIIAEFRNTLEDLSGKSQLVIRGNGMDIPAGLTGRVAEVKGVGRVSPMIRGDVFYHDPDSRRNGNQPGIRVMMLGFDFLEENVHGNPAVIDYELEFHEGFDRTTLLTRNSHVMVPGEFADRHRIRPGGTLDLTVQGIAREFMVAGIIRHGSLQDLNGGDLVVCDIAAADHWLNNQGRLDQINVILDENAEPDEIRTRLMAVLPDTCLVEKPGAQGFRFESMLAAFRFNLNALGLISLLVGAFLIYSTLNAAMVRRYGEIGTLRAMGVSRRTIHRVFLAEGALLGLVGGLAGLVLGSLIAGGMFHAVSAAVSINFMQLPESELSMDVRMMLKALVLGILFSIIAAWKPAAVASRTQPANTIRGSVNGRSGFRGIRQPVVLGFILLALSFTALFFYTRHPDLVAQYAILSHPVAGYTLVLGFLFAIIFFCGPCLELVCSCLKRGYSRIFGVPGLVAVTGTKAESGKLSLAIGGMLVVLGMALAVTVMVGSFRKTVNLWMNQVLKADLYFSSGIDASGQPNRRLPHDFAGKIRNLAAVDSVDTLRKRKFLVLDRLTWLGVRDFSEARYSADYRDLEGRRPGIMFADARRNAGVIVSETFSRKTGLVRGDTVPLPTPRGVIHPKICGVYYEYSTEQGFIQMDRRLYREYWDDTDLDSIAVFLSKGAEPAAVEGLILEIAGTLNLVPDLRMRRNAELRQFALQAFDRTFRVTHVMELIALLIAMLGVANTLFSRIIDRKPELATLRKIGMSMKRTVRMIMLESSLIGLAGLILGLPLGLLMAWILAKVIMLQSFGWTIQFHVPWPSVFMISGLVYLAAIIAGSFSGQKSEKMISGSSLDFK
jgi:putative ABC transport system permease protein